ncbi:hypothetical protein [Effusibacillus pohliae]|uniref:hypothetical protein n=1 Tax=Effusibacillus pohliae TaxID=232270 RepID=UPI0003669D1A|nr:hypothetical protein [Effusibacillus pohliae]
MSYKKWAIAVLASSVALTACGAKQTSQPAGQANQQAEATKEQNAAPADQVKLFKEMVEELEKAEKGEKVDFDKVSKLYADNLKKLVQARDSEFNEQLDQQISNAIKAGKDGSLKPDVVQELVHKLGLKAFFLSLRHEFKEIEEHFADKKEAKEEFEEAETFYGALKTTVEKRDQAYQTQLASTIDGAFKDMEKAVDSGQKLDFSLAKQVIDKSLMKAFYLAAGGAQGYAYKIEKAVKEGKDAKAAQAEAWAFYQSLYGYLVKSAKEDAEFIQKKFDLQTDAKEIKGDEINKSFVRAFALVAKSEYQESFENFGKDKGPVTALEGALFISVIESDAKKILGEAATKTLLQQADELVKAAKANDKAKAEALYKEIKPSLDKLANAGK